MFHQRAPQDNPILAAWQTQLEHARTNPFLFQLLLKQYQRVLKRLSYFYQQLASLPRRKRRALQRALATSLIGAAMLLALSSAPVVHANSITVSGACTLDEAITNANDDAATFPDCAAGSGADSIYLTANITLGGALPDITSEITLEGGNFFVSGADTFRVFSVTSTGDFTINETTVKEGNGSNYGGGIYNQGTLEVNDSTVSDSMANHSGGGIYNGNILTVNNSTVSGNSATNFGGGITNYGTVTLNNSTVSGNTTRYGGGIYNGGAMLVLNNSTVSGNTATLNGGGIATTYGTVNIYNSLITGNDAAEGGGIHNAYGNLTVTDSTISYNDALGEDGGGLRNAYGTTTVQNSVVYGNTAVDDGGGLNNRGYGGTMFVINTTMSGNSAGTGSGNIGGGFRGAIGAISYLSNVTITNNSAGDDGGGLAFEPGDLTLKNSIISGNKARSSYTDSFADCYDYGMTDLGHNLVGDGTGCPTSGTGDLTVLPADVFTTVLGDLLDNGGPTKTHALLTGSPAINAGNPEVDGGCTDSNNVPLTTDQRGFMRPVNSRCDIGAFEVQNTTAVNVTNVRGVARDDKNVVKWQTTSESQIAGFNVWRKNDKGAWKQVNAKFKQAKHAGSAEGANYRFADKKVKTRSDKNHPQVYRYKIQVNYLDGHDEWTESVRVKTP